MSGWRNTSAYFTTLKVYGEQGKQETVPGEAWDEIYLMLQEILGPDDEIRTIIVFARTDRGKPYRVVVK